MSKKRDSLVTIKAPLALEPSVGAKRNYFLRRTARARNAQPHKKQFQRQRLDLWKIQSQLPYLAMQPSRGSNQKLVLVENTQILIQ